MPSPVQVAPRPSCRERSRDSAAQKTRGPAWHRPTSWRDEGRTTDLRFRTYHARLSELADMRPSIAVARNDPSAVARYDSLIPRSIPCSGQNNSLFRIAGNLRLHVRNHSGIRAASARRQRENVEIPCIFPAIRESGPETGSRWTRSSAIESAVAETSPAYPSTSRENPAIPRGFG